ncbi:MAG: UDP-4-amino-4,6-dideoxy-N-acetyl-beta-L-altrosamine transaminase [Proteobacteria bacterium]|nr:UDP-4-amino-4,6-dideoxy-N-acetyl-beta-L-altrosamine transaminase [Pseudomonadota bacterium]
MKNIRYGQQVIDEDDIQSVINVLQSDFLTCGPFVERFEKALCEYTGAKYAVAVCNATAALHLSCLALDLGPKDILWTSPNSFVASSNCGLYCGASVDFVDIDDKTYNLSTVLLAQKLEQAKKNNCIPKVVIPVHFAGASCDMQAIHSLSLQYGFKIIEDASHAVGATYNQLKVGNCQFSDMAVFSFHPVKIITTGEGGVILTNNKALYEKAKLLRSHGITRDTSTVQATGKWFYEMLELGYNYRITDLQCALGSSQLTKIEAYIKRRHEIALRYDQHLHDLPLTLPFRDAKNPSALHLYPILVENNKKNLNRKAVFEKLQEKGIGVNVHYIPIPSQPYYKNLGFDQSHYPKALSYYEKAISLPIHYALTEQEQDYIIQCLYEIFQ